MANHTQAKVLTAKEAAKLHYQLPQSWVKAAGLLKGRKRLDALRYQRQIRQEWEKRLRSLHRSLGS